MTRPTFQAPRDLLRTHSAPILAANVRVPGTRASALREALRRRVLTTCLTAVVAVAFSLSSAEADDVGFDRGDSVRDSHSAETVLRLLSPTNARPSPLAGRSGMTAVGSGDESKSQEHESVEQPVDLTKYDLLIERLGANQFATREAAADELLGIGMPAVPALNAWLKKTDDAEVLLRIRVIVGQLKSGDFESRIESFLAGDDRDAANWPVMRYIFGDSIPTREIYVELWREYPDLIRGLDQPPTELVKMVRAIHRRLDEKKVGHRELPSRPDLLAALLPASDARVPLSIEQEARLLGMLNVYVANNLRRDRVLGKGFKALVAKWAERSKPIHRTEVLRLTMRWDMDTALSLASETLRSDADPEKLATAFQAISKYGTPNDGKLLQPYFDDQRELLRPLYQSDSVNITLADAAMAAVAVINDLPLVDLGFTQSAEHPTFGFIYDQLAFPVDGPDRRDDIRRRIQGLVEPSKELSVESNDVVR